MSAEPPMLFMLCGKIGSGKSTLAARLAAENAAVLIAEDEWLDTLFSDQLHTLADYRRCAGALRAVMAPHVALLLQKGSSVVLDFQANTVESRAWLRGILDATGAAHELHVLDTPDDVCLARLKQRNATGDHPFAPSEAQFVEVSKHFAPVRAEEGFTLVIHSHTG